MKLHEFQAKTILARRHACRPGAWTPEVTTRAAGEIGGTRFVAKARILAGGRGETLSFDRTEAASFSR